MDLRSLNKVDTLVVGIGGKPVRVEGSVELMITLGDRDKKKNVIAVIYGCKD